jgi:hypothetical protein
MMDHTRQFQVCSHDLLILLPCLRSFSRFGRNLTAGIFGSIGLACFGPAFLGGYDFALSSFGFGASGGLAFGLSSDQGSCFARGFFQSFSMLAIMAIC